MYLKSAWIAGAGLAVLPWAAVAQLYTDPASFAAAVGAGGYYEDFSSYSTSTGVSAPSFSFSGGTDPLGSPFAYTVSAPNIGAFTSDVLAIDDPSGNHTLTTALDGFALKYDFTSGNVRAVGGLFGFTDVAGNLLAGQLQFDLSDGTSLLVDTTAGSYSFEGFVVPDGAYVTGLQAFPIEGLDGSGNPIPAYIANAGLLVGVPEASTYAAAGFMGLCVGGLWLRRARKNA